MTEGKRVSKITVRREIAASAEDLFDAWLDPESLAQWMIPPDITQIVPKVNAIVGGTFEIVMHHTSLGPVPHRGVYKVIDRPRRLVFTWSSLATHHLETLVTVEFRAGKLGTTEVVITQEGLPDTEAEQKHTRGWTGILNVLSKTRLS
jgi:uncharacterized protein YndB with AHSA1/START domain